MKDTIPGNIVGLSDISLKKAKKSERVESILLGAIVPISKQDIIQKVPDISVKTVELVFGKLLKEKKIKNWEHTKMHVIQEMMMGDRRIVFDFSKPIILITKGHFYEMIKIIT